MKKRFKLLIIFVIFFILLIGYMLYEANNFTFSELFFNNNSVPTSFINKKIIYISDIHFGTTINKQKLEEIVNSINSQNPYLVLIGGDIIDDDSTLFDEAFSILDKLQAEKGIFTVSGNHDDYLDYLKFTTTLSKTHIQNLNNNAVWIEEGPQRIRLGGVRDFWSNDYDLSKIIEKTTEDDFVILLAHNPDYVEELKTKNIDLVLSGHTHGGQITLFGLYAPFAMSIYGQKYVRGLVKTYNTQVFVSNGIGTTWLPFRFFAPAEVNEILLKTIY